MKPVPAYTLAHSRREARQDARAAIEFKAARERALKRSGDARRVFKGVVASLDLPTFKADAILAAAESMAKADVVAAGMRAPSTASCIAFPAISPPLPQRAVPDRRLIEHRVLTTEVELADHRKKQVPDLVTIAWLEREQTKRLATLSDMGDC